MLLKLKDDTPVQETLTVLEEPVTYEQWLSGDVSGGKALYVPNDVELAGIGADVSGFETILLEFPAYKDGRAFTQARLLRERFGFSGDIRATGEVLRDQALYMLRCGFTSFDVTDGTDISGFEDAFEEFNLFYQPAVGKPVPVWTLRVARGETTRLSA